MSSLFLMIGITALVIIGGLNMNEDLIFIMISMFASIMCFGKTQEYRDKKRHYLSSLFLVAAVFNLAFLIQLAILK